MRDVDLALSQVSLIRAQLTATTRFLGISPEFNLLMAVLALAVAVVQGYYPALQDGLGYIAVWGSMLIASTGAVVVDAVARARRLHGRMANAMLKAALGKALPFYLTAAFVTWAICTFSAENIRILPGLWLMLIGLLGCSALPSLPRKAVWVAAWYLLCGAAVLLLSLTPASEPQPLSPWLLGIPFTIGHLFVALVFSKASDSDKPQGANRVSP